jgi:hypothetical protein
MIIAGREINVVYVVVLAAIVIVAVFILTMPREECVPAGNITSGAPCCEGLSAFKNTYYDQGRCQTQVNDVICLACGDSVCGLGENLCNCPYDCRTVLD